MNGYSIVKSRMDERKNYQMCELNYVAEMEAELCIFKSFVI
jgi:hypothetical protein